MAISTKHHNVTLSDIAARAGVSKTAVSKVLNARPIRIGAEKRADILALAKSLNYRPNIIARSLKESTTRTIGIVIPDLTTLFYPELVRRIETRLAAEGYQTIIGNSGDDPVRERQHLDNLLGRLVDGLILVPAAGSANLAFLRSIHDRGIPFLMLDRFYPGELFRYVATDNRGGAAMGADWLLKEGATRVLYLGEKRRNHALEERLAGVRDAASGANMQFFKRDVFLCHTDRSTVGATCRKLLERTCSGTGVFLESHRMMLGLLDACCERDLRIPTDLPTVGFDTFEPALTTNRELESLQMLTAPPAMLRQNTVALAEEACSFLLSNFEGNSEGVANWQRILKTDLITAQ